MTRDTFNIIRQMFPQYSEEQIITIIKKLLIENPNLNDQQLIQTAIQFKQQLDQMKQGALSNMKK